jgi:tetratricopeptide (TPR) repeat protein
MTGERDPIPATDLSEASFIRLADAHRREGLVEDAIRICREGLARYPSSLRGRILLGQSLLDQGAIGEAIVELGRVERDARNDPEILTLLCEVRVAGPQWTQGAAESRGPARGSAAEAEAPVLILETPGQPTEDTTGPGASRADPLASSTLADLYASQGDRATADAILRQIAPEEAAPAAEPAADAEPPRYLEELRRLRDVAGRLRRTQAR